MSRLLIPSLLTALLALGACSKPQPPTLGFYPTVANGDLEQLKRHLFWHTDVNQQLPNGDTALHVAARNGDPAVVRMLLDAGANPTTLNTSGDTPLETALKNRRIRIAEMLIEAGAPFEGERLLFTMVRAGISDRDVYRLLARHGVDFNAVNDAGDTPLSLAIANGRPAVVKQLILHGADVRKPRADGQRPLALSQQRGVQEIVQLLKMNGAE